MRGLCILEETCHQPSARNVKACAKMRRAHPKAPVKRFSLNRRARESRLDDDTSVVDPGSDKQYGDAARITEADLLRELNGGIGSASEMLEAFDGASWGTDDISGFAQRRAVDNPTVSSERSQPTKSPKQSQKASAGKQSQQMYGSELPGGITWNQNDGQLVVEQLYASRNANVLKALRQLGCKLQVQKPEDIDEDLSLGAELDAFLGATSSLLDEDEQQQTSHSDAMHDSDGSADMLQPVAFTQDNGEGLPEGMVIDIPDGDLSVVNAAPKLEADGWVVKTRPDGDIYLERAVPELKPASPSKPAASITSKQQPSDTNATSSPAPSTSRYSKPVAQSAKPASLPPQAASSQSAKTSMPKDGTSAVKQQGVPPVFTPHHDLHPSFKAAVGSVKEPEQVLEMACLMYPVWAAAGCRLAAPAVLAADPGSSTQSGTALGVAPTPAEAALLLQALAWATKRKDWSASKRLQLCSDIRVAGLVEALRLAPARLSPDQESNDTLAKSLNSLFASAAKQWWITAKLPATPSPAAPARKPTSDTSSKNSNQQATAPLASSSSVGVAADSGNVESSNLSPATRSTSSNSSKQSSGNSQGGVHAPQVSKLNGHVPADISSSLEQLGSSKLTSMSSLDDGAYGQLLSKYMQASTPAADSSQKKKKKKKSKADKVAVSMPWRPRHEAIVAGLWSMAVLGGAAMWQKEMSALLTVAGAGATDWVCGPGEAGSIAWALATCRHWTPLLSKLAAQLGKCGPCWQMSPDEISRVLWSYASLNASLQGLPLNNQWSWKTAEGSSGHISSFSPIQLATVCWSMAVARQTQHPAFTTAWHQLLLQHDKVATSGDVILTQVWQVCLEMILSKSDQSSPAVQPDEQGSSVSAMTRTAAGSGTSFGSATALQDAAIAAALSPFNTPHSAASDQGSHVTGSAQHHLTDKQMQGVHSLLQKAAAAFLEQSKSIRGGPGSAKLNRTGPTTLTPLGSTGYSSYQRQMGNALVQLRHMHVVEDITSGYAVDLSLPLLRIAVEADGPTHFSRVPGPPSSSAVKPGAAAAAAGVKPQSRPQLWTMGPTAMKRRHLEALGWTVLSMSTQDWDAASSPALQQELLRRRIEGIMQDRLEASAAQVMI